MVNVKPSAVDEGSWKVKAAVNVPTDTFFAVHATEDSAAPPSVILMVLPTRAADPWRTISPLVNPLAVAATMVYAADATALVLRLESVAMALIVSLALT